MLIAAIGLSTEMFWKDTIRIAETCVSICVSFLEGHERAQFQRVIPQRDSTATSIYVSKRIIGMTTFAVQSAAASGSRLVLKRHVSSV